MRRRVEAMARQRDALSFVKVLTALQCYRTATKSSFHRGKSKGGYNLLPAIRQEVKCFGENVDTVSS